MTPREVDAMSHLEYAAFLRLLVRESREEERELRKARRR